MIVERAHFIADTYHARDVCAGRAMPVSVVDTVAPDAVSGPINDNAPFRVTIKRPSSVQPIG